MIDQIHQFLGEKRIGFAGASRNASKYSNKVYDKLRESGYDLHPVHPEAPSIAGIDCVRDLTSLPDDVRALMVIARPAVTASILRQASESNIDRIWVFSGPGDQSAVRAELDRLQSSGINVISGFCPFMFLEPVGSIHAVHRFLMRLFRQYPR